MIRNRLIRCKYASEGLKERGKAGSHSKRVKSNEESGRGMLILVKYDNQWNCQPARKIDTFEKNT